MKKLIGSKSRLLAGIGFLFAVLIISNSCTKTMDNPYNTGTGSGNNGGSGGPGANEVFIQSNTFNPGTITVPVNTTITWTNKDGIAHTVTSNTAGQFDSGNLSANGTWSHLFSTAGTYQYHCKIHSSMTGTVIVM